MAYLIAHLSGFLLLTLIFAAVAGWSWHASRTAAAVATSERERSKLVRDISTLLAGGEITPGNGEELEREMDTLRRRADLTSARVVELESALETARARAEEAVGRAAEAERALERVEVDTQELARLREMENTQTRTVDVEASPVLAPVAADDEAAAQGWRLRYFEQRVRYLESQARAGIVPPQEPQPVAAPVVEATPDETQRLDWRARYAEARVRHLEQALRDATVAPPAPDPEPQLVVETPPPADPTEDALVRWRQIYLEKRVAHLQALAPAAPPAPAVSEETDTEMDRLKWRNHFLEARIREFEARGVVDDAPVVETPPAPQPVAAIEDEDEYFEDDEGEIEEAPPQPLVPAGAEVRPSAMPAARDGAADDFTLIEGVSPMQQSTLYSLGIYHFEQIAAWTPANVAWVDQYLRLRGRISQEEWVEQARDLARGGVAAARRLQEEPA